MQIRVNTIEALWDNQVRPIDTDWETFRAVLLEGHEVAADRIKVKLFNAVEYKSVDDLREVHGATVDDRWTGVTFTRRLNENVLTVQMLVLDYDGGLSLEDAKHRFEEFEYVAYTSFSHRKDNKSDRFRIVLPLLNPIPASGHFSDCDDLIDGSAWYELEHALRDFAGPCDPASFRCNQFFYLPVSPRERESLAQVWSNSGRLVDWTSWARKPVQGPWTSSDARSSSTYRSTRTLDPNAQLRTQQGPFRLRDVVGKVEGVWCPFHEDRNGSEFVKHVPETGNTFLFCRKCNQSYFMAETTPSIGEVNLGDELLKFDAQSRTTSFVDPTDRTHVDEQLRKICDSIRSTHVPGSGSRPIRHPSHLIYMPEGTGKSRMAFDIAAAGSKVIFACKSLAQVFSKYDEFCSLSKRLVRKKREAAEVAELLEPTPGVTKISPVNVTMLLSKGAKARRRFGVDPVRGERDDPYDIGEIDDEASIQAFMNAQPKLSEEFIRLSWLFFGADRLHFGKEVQLETNEDGELVEVVAGWEKYSSADIIVTTFAQARILRARNQYIPWEWIAWFDDPDISDFSDIETYDPERWGEFTEEEEKAKGIVQYRSRQKYFKRDEQQSLGRAVRHHRCVYTTTERMTLRAAKIFLDRRDERVIVHDEMEGVSGGQITILGTQAVYSGFDGIIPLMIRRLEKEEYTVTLIADGLSHSHNHSNTKGMNNLKARNLVVEISAPHPSKVMTICDSLGLDFKADSRSIGQDLMLDQLHQALGRNSGYRYQGSECVALVPANQHSTILSEVRYVFDEQNSVLIDRTADMSRGDRRTRGSPSKLVLAIENFLNNFEIYIQDKRKVLPDVKYVLDQLQDETKRISYASRLLHALSSHSTIRFDRPPTAEDRSHRRYNDYEAIVTTILKSFPGEHQKDQLFIQYRQRMGIDTQESSEDKTEEVVDDID
jgi:hypothetical protein